MSGLRKNVALSLVLSLASLAACSDDGGSDPLVPQDAGFPDLSAFDAGLFFDTGPLADSGRMDATTSIDTGPMDAETMDAEPMDAEPMDADPIDTGFDVGPPDTGIRDAEIVDTGLIDGGTQDAGVPATAWRQLATAPLTARSNPAFAWTGTEMIVWSGAATGRAGARYNPTLNQWTAMTTVGAPADRVLPTSVWTGTRLFMWGGIDPINFNPLTDGSLYDPATNTWQALPLSPIPFPSGRASGVWTGTRVFIMGTLAVEYNPAANTWTPVSTVGQPAGRIYPAMAWTGTEVLVWSGLSPTLFTGLNDGARFNPATNTWTAMSAVGAPIGRGFAVTAWTGTELLVWGGYELDPVVGLELVGNGGAYNPTTNTWRAISTTGAPTARFISAYGWTGTELLIWGGAVAPGGTMSAGDGFAYNPATNTWRTLPATGAPSARQSMASAWTGTELLIWGGSSDVLGTTNFSDGYGLTP